MDLAFFRIYTQQFYFHLVVALVVAFMANVIVLTLMLAALDLSHFALGTVATVIDAFAFIVDVDAILELFV